ncbi:hypothetical protein [Halorubrum distributum]|uniref:hypothetical protein n=1 Tax=Halorubrum distributum TaxID=29283 RepID=UPI0013909D99|nr:hypothetical protein [Halorubrum litoreum]
MSTDDPLLIIYKQATGALAVFSLAVTLYVRATAVSGASVTPLGAIGYSQPAEPLRFPAG